MSGEGCTEMELLIQADLDGELTPAEAARVAAHLPRCASCTATQAQLGALSARLRHEAPYHPASAALRAAVRQRVAALATTQPTVAAVRPPWWRSLSRLAGRFSASTLAAGPFAAGLAVACLLVVLLPGRHDELADAVVAGHIRALQPGHLMDVPSTDRHTVKPWFDGRLDYAPPVKDFKQAGFPLTGGRLDYLAGRPVAALVYQRQQHVIDVFVWPDSAAPASPGGERSGYNFVRWRQGGMTFWAVSDLEAAELADFARLWRAG